MSHRCVYVKKDGQQCGFHLPDSYPLPVCPWHFADQVEEKYKLIALAAGIAMGAGVVLAAKIAPGMLRRLQEKLEPREDTQHDYGEAAPNVIDFQEAVNRRRQAGMAEFHEVSAGESDESREK
jgi:hypothetical protein